MLLFTVSLDRISQVSVLHVLVPPPHSPLRDDEVLPVRSHRVVAPVDTTEEAKLEEVGAELNLPLCAILQDAYYIVLVPFVLN